MWQTQELLYIRCMHKEIRGSMDIHFVPVAFSDIREKLQQHLATLSSLIDSYLEDHILHSRHYQIVVAGDDVGFAAIHKETLITQFALADQYKQLGQPAFRQLRTLEQVQSAFVATCDEFYLAHALDDYRQLAKQAYFFSLAQPLDNLSPPQSFALQAAEPADHTFIRLHSGDFFIDLEQYIEANALFLVQSGDDCVGFGLIETSKLYHDVASIGMYTIERFRRSGMGTTTLRLLINECRRRGLKVVAGCWYYNHASKKALERAGMFTKTRLLKIDY
jgi:RimJ/RimL family protein N-acetyltransferase